MWCFAPAFQEGFRTQHPIQSSHSTILKHSSYWSKLFLWLHGHKFSWTPKDPWVQSSPKRCHLSTPSAHVDQPWVSRALHVFTWFDVIPRRPGLVVAFRNVGEKMPTKETIVSGGASCWTLSVGWRVTLYYCMTFILRPVIWNNARQEVRLCYVLYLVRMSVFWPLFISYSFCRVSSYT